MKKLRNSLILGLNVTIPYKESVISCLDELDPIARKIFAINVIHNDKGKLTGYNTDYTGFKRALRKYDHLNLENAVILGAGGAARSVIYALYTLNFKKIVFFSRNRKRINRIMRDFYFIKVLKGHLWEEIKIKAEIRSSDVLINATPVGMFPDENKTPIEIDFQLKDNFLVFDLIYNPRLTKFLKGAKNRGALIENGINMLIFQAMESLKIWNREIINEELFIKNCEEVLNASISNSW
jgi:shikimate dehydrogenase